MTAPAQTRSRPRPVVLCVLDGWGERAECEDNAILCAEAPTWRHFVKDLPTAQVQASALDVGLPPGQMGNSEVGHMNLGAGRVVMQDMPRIDAAIADGSLAANPVLRDAIARMKASGGTLHICGLISPGGVHSHQDEIAALARIVGAHDVPVAIHAYLDGRDTPPRSALGYLKTFENAIKDVPGPGIVTVTGRYWAMDRDKRWERVERAFRVMMAGEGERAPSARAAVEAAYARNETDEFVAPTAIGDFSGIKDGDGLAMGNFRADRAREILLALLDPGFDGFARARAARFAATVAMTEYSTRLNELMAVLFVSESLDHLLGQVVSEAGLRQLRIAETEKYAHVTFFFNGGVEEPYKDEDRILVPSPKVATYDLKPEMSAAEVTDKLIAAIESGKYDFILVNYANGDMVGHTGVLDAAIKAVEAVDACLARLEAAVRKAGGVMLVTADHGNAELMRDYELNQPHTAHTTNVVPLVLVNAPAWVEGVKGGRLADLAPTVLSLMGLPQPKDMTGTSLLRLAGSGQARERASA
ncbi:MAG: 2,3-bisphosphoglycerate-independent phosphoglycerate mutase [Pseudomonadota bacterium]|jgi:2,3-bisphosphoglycerate-independent phosphoglycerate mutase